MKVKSNYLSTFETIRKRRTNSPSKVRRLNEGKRRHRPRNILSFEEAAS